MQDLWDYDDRFRWGKSKPNFFIIAISVFCYSPYFFFTLKSIYNYSLKLDIARGLLFRHFIVSAVFTRTVCLFVVVFFFLFVCFLFFFLLLAI